MTGVGWLTRLGGGGVQAGRIYILNYLGEVKARHERIVTRLDTHVMQDWGQIDDLAQ